MKNVSIVLLFALLFCGTSLSAQSYITGLGLRLGNIPTHRTLGLTLQQRIFKQVTLEGIVQTDFQYNSTAHLLIEKHNRIISKRFNYYVGCGFSVGNEQSTEEDHETQTIITTFGNKTMGVDLIAGIEATLLGFTASLDFKPNINLVGRNKFFQSQVGISLRYVLIRKKSFLKR